MKTQLATGIGQMIGTRRSMVRWAVVALTAVLVGQGAASAATEGNPLFDQTPHGVTVEVLAQAGGVATDFHVDELIVERITMGCAAVSPILSREAQLVLVEWGAVEMRDNQTGEVIATLAAGDAAGPDHGGVYFTIAPGSQQASLLRFRVEPDGARNFPAFTYETSGCGGISANDVPAVESTSTVLFASGPMERGRTTTPGPEYTLSFNLVTVAPGFALAAGSPPVAQEQGYTVVIPLAGGFGDGNVVGGAGPEFGGTFQYADLFANPGTIQAVALVASVVPAGEVAYTLGE